MDFRIKIIAGEVKDATTKTGKPYKLVDLTYRDLGQDKVAARKVTQYNTAFEVIKNSKAGEVYDITASKKEGSTNWDWDKAVKVDDASGNVQMPATAASADAGPTGSPSTARAAPKSNYETPEERAVKQAAINRSAAVSRAIEFLEANAQGKVFTIGDVLQVAVEFDKYIRDGVKTNAFADMQDDLVD